MSKNIKSNNNKQISIMTEPLSRKQFLKLSASAVASVGVAAALSSCADNDFSFAGRDLRFRDFDDVRAELDLIEANQAAVVMYQEFTLHKLLIHLSQSIEFSMSGFPETYPDIVQAAGAIAFDGFAAQGFVVHDLSVPVPSAPTIPEYGDMEAAFARLRLAMETYENFTGVPFEHFAYGSLSYEEFLLANAMHIADHFSMLSYGPV